MFYVTNATISEINLTAEYYITVDMNNIDKPFGIKVQVRGGGCETVNNIYTTAAEALAAARRFAENTVLPNTLRDIIRDELMELVLC